MKRIILCLDGTWNDNRAGSTLTNVAKLHQVHRRQRQQRRAADRALSSRASPRPRGKRLQFLKGAVGFGVGDRIRKAYETARQGLRARRRDLSLRFLARRLRGAQPRRIHHTVRSGQGRRRLLHSTRPGRSIARAKKERDQAALAELRAAAHYPARIKCVGVWDTVGNIGNPFISGGPIGRLFEFHDTRLCETHRCRAARPVDR